MPRCLDCAYWRPHRDWDDPLIETANGDCRRHAPLGEVKMHGYITTYFPLMPANGWCGDFTQRTEENSHADAV